MSNKTETKDLVLKLKQNDEDFEFYPTTDEIIKRLCKELEKTKEKLKALDCVLGEALHYLEDDGEYVKEYRRMCREARKIMGRKKKK